MLVLATIPYLGYTSLISTQFLTPEGRILNSISQLFCWKISICHLKAQLSWSRVLLTIRAREQQCLKDQYLAAKIKMEKQIWIFAFLATFVKGKSFFLNYLIGILLSSAFFSQNSCLVLIKT